MSLWQLLSRRQCQQRQCEASPADITCSGASLYCLGDEYMTQGNGTLTGWFNGVDQEVLESWSGHNSVVSASQDQVGTTLLTTIGGWTLPNPVRVPDNMVQPAVLRGLMEGPVWPWQCLVWLEEDPPEYSRRLPALHTGGPSHVLLQIGPLLVDIDSEYRGGVIKEEIENEGGGASVE